MIAGTPEYGYIKRILFSHLSTQIFNDVFEATRSNSLSDEEFIRRFSEKVGLLEILVLYIGLSIGRYDQEEGGKWIVEAFGTLTQVYAWRRCFFRQIFRGEYDLKHPVSLTKPVYPELKEDLVELPRAFVPGISEKIQHAAGERKTLAGRVNWRMERGRNSLKFRVTVLR